MHRTWAIVERELRRFRRSPMLIVMSMIFPLLQLVVLGYAFGGNVKHLRLAIVDQDHGVPAVKMRELAGAVSAGARTLDLLEYTDPGEALTDLRNGLVNGVLEIPPDFSRRTLTDQQPRVALISDNTDTFVSATLAATVNSLVGAFNTPVTVQRVMPVASLDVVEVYPYVPYIQYLLPGSITMSIFMMVMIGGGIIFIDDKARGLSRDADHQAGTGRRLQHLRHDQGGARRCRHHRHRLSDRGGAQSARPDSFSANDARDHPDVLRAAQPDVPADGARHRSVVAAGDLRRVEHSALFPERRRLPPGWLP